MEANVWGFNVESNPCTFGTCDPTSQSSVKVNDDNAFNYGNGSEYTIDTSKSFSVTTQFWATQDTEGTPMDLASIKTILEQEGRVVEMIQDDADYINWLSW